VKRKDKRQRQRRERRSRNRKLTASILKKAEWKLRGQKITTEPTEDGVKMSEVLDAFIEPYRHTAPAGDELRKLISLAIGAWNIALSPPEEQEAMLQSSLDDITDDEDIKTDLREVLAEMIERKNTHFSEYRRVIIDFQLTDLGDEDHLTVISTSTGIPES
jgi:hypothetical protein